MVIRKLTHPENNCYYAWWRYYHKDKDPEIIMTDEIAVVEVDGIFTAGIMVQRISNASFLMFSGITRNPFCDREVSSKSVDFLLSQLGPLAKKLGYQYFVSLVGEEAARTRYRKNGIKEFKTPLTFFWGQGNV